MDWQAIIKDAQERLDPAFDKLEAAATDYKHRLLRLEKMMARLSDGHPVPLSVPDIEIELLPDGKMPHQARQGDACLDCFATGRAGATPEFTHVPAGMNCRIQLGFKLAIPPGWKVMLWGRSSMAVRRWSTHIGTIDSGYRDEVCVLLQNTQTTDLLIKPYERICQMSLERVWPFELKPVSKIPPADSDRAGGFGSTGT